jgi:hypothetical protein
MKIQHEVFFEDLTRSDIFIDMYGRRPIRFRLEIGSYSVGLHFPDVPRAVLEGLRDEITRALDYVDGRLPEEEWANGPADGDKRLA